MVCPWPTVSAVSSSRIASGAGATRTLQEAVLPLWVRAVMTALPGARASTCPVSGSTEATAGSEEMNCTEAADFFVRV